MKDHWEAVYTNKRPEHVSWYQPHLRTSLALLERAGLNADSSIIDVGGGCSTLVDDLLERGIAHPTVLDISGQALAATQARLGVRAAEVDWLEADITQARLPERAYDIWHDRAVFHFLTRAEDRQRYTRTMKASLKPGGQVIIATFGPHAPPRCSGLEVVRYRPETLHAALGNGLQLMEAIEEAHRTPADTTQPFVYCRFTLA